MKRLVSRRFLRAVGLAVACVSATACEGIELGELPPVAEGGGGAGAAAATTTTGPNVIHGAGSGNDPNDQDGDGFSPAEGDCDDMDPNRNPNAVEVATAPSGTPSDEDCDGETDEADPGCDASLAIDDDDPRAAARAIDLCKDSKGPGDWGLVRADWVMADGSAPPATEPERAAYALGHGLLADFGTKLKPKRGSRLLALSSGAARDAGDPDFQSGLAAKNYTDNFAPGFPKESPACPGVASGQPFDTAALELELRTPSNATGLRLATNFHTNEWPSYVCSPFNDFFLALVSPTPSGQADGNVAFDAEGNTLSVNSGLVEVCGCDGNPPSPCMAGGKAFPCAKGPADLEGTGFEGHAATGWLETTAPVKGGDKVVLRLVVHDSGDGALNSTTLVDDLRWLAGAGVTPGTVPIEE